MLTLSELQDDAVLDALAHDPRTGCLALWSITLVFILPGLLDHELWLLVVGVTLGCAAAFASGRSIARASARRSAPVRFRPAGAPEPRRNRPVATPCRTTTRPRFRSELLVALPCTRGRTSVRGGPRSRRLRGRGCARTRR